VVSQFQTVFGPEVRTVCDIEENAEMARKVVPRGQITEISRIFAAWFNRLRRCHIPFLLQIPATLLLFPIWLIVNEDNRWTFGCVLEEIRSCSCLYYYGGTQLSEQWFDANFPPLLLLMLLCRCFGKPVYWGPQQYGPEKKWQWACLRFAITHFVTDASTRNDACRALLGLPETKLLCDEVFSCTRRYPINSRLERPRTFILINMRASNFVRDATEAEYRAYGALLSLVHQRVGLPFKLFQMSGVTFCDDRQFHQFLDPHGFGHLPVEILPPLEDEQALIDLAERAYGTISMSFHGCIFSMIGGCPAVPVTSGPYYDYKYADFDRYTGNQRVPLISLQHLDLMLATDTVVAYFERYDPARTAETRVRAAARIGSWYLQIRNQCATEVSEPEAEHLSEVSQ